MITRPRETISRGPFLLSVRYAHVLGTTGTFQHLCHIRALPGRVRMGEVSVIADLVGYLVVIDKVGEQADNGQYAENDVAWVQTFTSFQLSEKFSTASMIKSTTAPTA